MAKKLVVILSGLTFLTLLFPISAEAAKINPCAKGAGGGFFNLCDLGLGTTISLVQNGVTILFIVATITALFFLIFGGIRWITSGGDKAQLESARNTIIAAVVGLILTFSAFFILNITLQFLGLNPATKFVVPKLGGTTYTCGGSAYGTCPSGQSCKATGSFGGSPIFECK